MCADAPPPSPCPQPMATLDPRPMNPGPRPMASHNPWRTATPRGPEPGPCARAPHPCPPPCQVPKPKAEATHRRKGVPLKSIQRKAHSGLCRYSAGGSVHAWHHILALELRDDRIGEPDHDVLGEPSARRGLQGDQNAMKDTRKSIDTRRDIRNSLRYIGPATLKSQNCKCRAALPTEWQV